MATVMGMVTLVGAMVAALGVHDPTKPIPVWPAPGASPPFIFSLAHQEMLCNKGDADACADAAERYLRRLIVNDEEVIRDPPRAFRLMERACTHGHGTSCFELAFNYGYGREGFRVDVARGRTLLKIGCMKGDDASCKAVSVGALSPPLRVAGGFHSRQWDDGEPPLDEAEAQCMSGIAYTCASAGYKYQQVRSARANALYEHGCALGSGQSCYLLSETLGDRGVYVLKDWRQRVVLLKRSCRLGAWEGCYYLPRHDDE